MDPADTSARSALSQAQHKAVLWADPSMRVHAVVMADRIPAVKALTLEQVPVFDCLLPGVLAPEVERRAPYLLRLDPERPYTDWLLFAGSAELGEWGALVLSSADFVPLRNHLRGFCQARLADGSLVPLAWMDPTLLRSLLPLCDGMQLSALFGGAVAAIGIADPASITLYRAPLGRLVSETTAIAA